MAARLIRDGILESEAINSVTVEAKWLYMVICLSADDLGLFEATEFKLSRKSDLKKESVANCLNLLSDAGLIRLYSAENKTYGFIPKFRQRLQSKRSRHPQPHPSIYADDEDAKTSFNKINGLSVNPLLDNGSSRLDNSNKTVGIAGQQIEAGKNSEIDSISTQSISSNASSVKQDSNNLKAQTENPPLHNGVQPPEVEVEVEKNKNKEAADSGNPVSEKSNPVSLQTYLEKCKAENRKPIPENDPVFQYTEKVGIPTEWVRLHWNIFKDRHTQVGAKRQKSWVQTFRNSVQCNWYGIWYIGADNLCRLTTKGKQAEIVYNERVSA